MEAPLTNCPNCNFDLDRVRGVLEQDTLAFCLKCQFPLQLVAGKYRLEREVWRGGSSVVYLARHIHLDRDAERVVKVIRPEIFKIHGMEHRFRREVQITSALSQRNDHIVRIYDDFGSIPELGHFYIMEYLQGETLSNMLEQLAELPPLPFVLHLMLQLCDTMQFAHGEGVVHRDLKPHNLMMVQRKNDPYFLKVFDFGIAKPLSNEELAVTHVTQGSLGTPAYMAPEQCLNQPTDVRTDIYAMGIMLYEMLTGFTPFLPPEGDSSAFSSAVGIIEGHLTKEPPSPREVLPDRVSERLSQVVLCALAKKPEQRFQTVEEFRVALEQVVEEWPAEEQKLLEALSSEKMMPEMELARKSPEDLDEEDSTGEGNDHNTWYLGASSRVVMAKDEKKGLDALSLGIEEVDIEEEMSVILSPDFEAESQELLLAIGLENEDERSSAASREREKQRQANDDSLLSDLEDATMSQESPDASEKSFSATGLKYETAAYGVPDVAQSVKAPLTAASEAETESQPSEPANSSIPTLVQSKKPLADRVHGPHNGLIRMFVVQREEWESDPFLVKKLQEKIEQLQVFIESADFARLYPQCQGKIVLEAGSFPPEVANRLMQDGIELRLLPGSQAPELEEPSKPALGTPSPSAPVSPISPTPAAGSSGPSEPVTSLSLPPVRPSTSSATSSATASGSVRARAISSASQPSVVPASYPTSNTNNKNGIPRGVSNHSTASSAPIDAPVLGESPTPVALWTGDLATKSNPSNSLYAMVSTAAIFVLSVLGMIYGLSGGEPVSTGPPKGVMTTNVSSRMLPKATYATVSITPDRRTFVLIPMVDNRSGAREVYVLFAAKENRKLLLFAPQSQSQILRRLREDKDPATGETGPLTPVWSQDLSGRNAKPRARTYTGSLEHLQRYKDGPLELVLPDGSRNINKILGYRQQGIQFPMDSMILKVGKRPQPPSNPYRSIVLVLSLLVALVSGGVFLGLRNKMQQPF